MFPLLIGIRIHNLMKKNQIEVLKHLPGQIEIYSPQWKNTRVVDPVVAELMNESGVHEVKFSKATGIMSISFDEALTKDFARIESWVNKLDKL